jgi:hypothetical protein
VASDGFALNLRPQRGSWQRSVQVLAGSQLRVYYKGDHVDDARELKANTHGAVPSTFPAVTTIVNAIR